MWTIRQLVRISCVAGLLASASPGAFAAERYAGVEIGAKGIKSAAVEVDSGGAAPTLRVLELDKKTVEVTISQLKEKNFKDELIGDVAEVVERFIQALVQKLQVPEANIRVVASSGMPFANNIADLVAAVREKTGKEIDRIDATEEALLTTIALVPKDQWTRTIVIDVGSGNTKGGEFLDASGKKQAFAAYNVPFGTVTLGKAIDEKAAAAGTTNSEVGVEVSRELIGNPLRRAFEKNTAKSKEPKQVLFAGGAVWAMVTITKPETALDPFPQVTAGDVKAYLALITKSAGKYPEVDFTRVVDRKTREAAEADYQRIQSSVFKPDDLLAGALILSQVSDALNFATRPVRFDRKAVTAWITAKITPPEYWSLLPKALGRDVPQPNVAPRAAVRMPERAQSRPPAARREPTARTPSSNNTRRPSSPLAVPNDPCGSYDPCWSYQAASPCDPTTVWYDGRGDYGPQRARAMPPAPTVVGTRRPGFQPVAPAQVKSTSRSAATEPTIATPPKSTASRKVQSKDAVAAHKTAAPVLVPNPAVAQEYYGQGLHYFWRADYSSALDQFRAAVAADHQDARFWYFKGLTERRLGLTQQASDSLARGAKLEVLGYPVRTTLYRSLERVQGAERIVLKEAALKAQLVQKSPPAARPTNRVAQSSP